MFDLTGKTALVTGGSYGLGVVFAHALADAGADIALTARSTDLLEKNAAEIAAKGRKATAHTGDVTVLADVQRVVDEVLAAHGKIDVLVNNAGVSDTRGIASENVDADTFRRTIEVDLFGVWSYAQAVGRHMLERRSGSIINISSMLGSGGSEYVNPAYHAAKAAVNNLTRLLATEWGDRGVRVNSLSPGYFVSEMTRVIFEDLGLTPWVEGRTPLRRLGEDKDLIGPIVFLASDEAAYVTGANLLVDGGYSAVMGANQFQVPWHLWNVPSAIGETYPGMAPLPDTINQQGLPGVHFPIPDRT
jgi:NAD(P)-dependent dehydrogenase (short-subunit alcohol dehydrogenase family)